MTIKTSFWQEYIKKTDKNASSSTPQQYEKIMMQGKKQLEGAIEDFRLKLSEIPLGAEIANWLERLDLPKEYVSRYTESMLHLIDLKLLSLTNKQGQLRNRLSEPLPGYGLLPRIKNLQKNHRFVWAKRVVQQSHDKNLMKFWTPSEILTFHLSERQEKSHEKF